MIIDSLFLCCELFIDSPSEVTYLSHTESNVEVERNYFHVLALEIDSEP